MCEHCGGSGVLNIVSWSPMFEREAPWFDEPYASPCHACPRGAEMVSIL